MSISLLMLSCLVNSAQKYASSVFKFSLPDAHSYCSSTYGTYVADIQSEDDLTAAHAECVTGDGTGDCWISLRQRRAVSLTYTWEDHIFNREATLTYWAEGEPDAEYYCTTIARDTGYWRSTDCESLFRPLCVLSSISTPNAIQNYAVSPDKYSFSGAASYCAANFGTYVADIKSEGDLAAASAECVTGSGTESADCWISLRQVVSSSTYYVWLDNITNDMATLTYWGDNEPDAAYYCTTINTDAGTWHSAACNYSATFRTLCVVPPTFIPKSGACPPGYQVHIVNGSYCEPCYTNQFGTDGTCRDCADGYQPTDGHTECQKCSGQNVGTSGYCGTDCKEYNGKANPTHTQCVENTMWYESAEFIAITSILGVCGCGGVTGVCAWCCKRICSE